MVQYYYFPCSMNHNSISLDKELVVMVGDHFDGLLVNFKAGKVCC